MQNNNQIEYLKHTKTKNKKIAFKTARWQHHISTAFRTAIIYSSRKTCLTGQVFKVNMNMEMGRLELGHNANLELGWLGIYLVQLNQDSPPPPVNFVNLLATFCISSHDRLSSQVTCLLVLCLISWA